jgi:adenylate kinase family enzyme
MVPDPKTAYIFYGRSGCGKGTQGDKLIAYLEARGRKVVRIETGSMLRTIAAGNSFTADLARKLLKRGGLMPVFMPIMAWATEFFKNLSGNEDVLLDGVARRLEEAKLLLAALRFYQYERKVVVHMKVSEEFATKLLTSRGRSDDTPSGIAARMKWFEKDVVPVIEYFRKYKYAEFVEVNGEQTIEEVWRELKTKLFGAQ